MSGRVLGNVTPYCDCAENGVTDIDALVELLNRGIDQRTASLALWSPDHATTHAAQVAGVQARLFVRRALHKRLPWLRKDTA